VFLVSPGYCATDLNNNSGYRTSEQGAKSLVLASERPASESGKLFTDDVEQPVAAPVPDMAAAAAADAAAKAKTSSK
jgi:hypothetical protein